MALTAKPTHSAGRPPSSAKPDSMKTAETVYLPAPPSTPALVIEDGKLPDPKAAAADWAACSNEKLRRKRNKEANR